MAPDLKELRISNSILTEHGCRVGPICASHHGGGELHKQAEMLLEGWMELLTVSAELALGY